MNFWQKHAAALGAALVIAGSTGVAYAADLGGIRTTVNVWLHGEHTQLDAVPNGTGGYEFYETGSDEPIGGGGGVWIDENGVEHAASAQEVAENGVAYAADLGGIRTTVNVWLHGEHTQLDAVPNGTGGYEFYETGSDEPIGGGGGVWIDENGVEHAASAQEVAENLASPVEVREDGTVWLSVNDRTWDITDYIQSGKSENFHAGSRYFRVLVEGTGVQTQTSDRPEPGIAYIELD